MRKIIRSRIYSQSIRKKNVIDKIVKNLFLIATLISASFIILIILFIISKGISPFISNAYSEGKANVFKFFSGTVWNLGPNIYSVGFIILNTLYISLLALLIAVPISVLTGLFISKVAPKSIGNILRTVIELLASIPSIVYGVFGYGFIVIFVSNIGTALGFQTAAGRSVLATVLVLTLMIIPTITAVAEVSIRSVDKTLEQGSLALGATKTQTNFKVVLTSAKSGIFTGAILGIGRALGEATAVSMVAGNRFDGPVFNLFETTRTLTSTMLLGLKETQGIDYDIRFSVGIVLMVVIIFTNIILNYIKGKVGSIDAK